MTRTSAKERASSAPGLPERRPLVLRKQAERREARRRMAARTRRAIAPEQRAHDPLLHRRRGPAARAGLVLLLLVGAAAIHLGVVTLGFVIGGRERPQRERIEQVVRVEVREPPPPPPPPPEEKRPEPPKPEPIVKKAPPPPKAKAPPPAPEPPKGPPPRVVGINLDSTVEGGGGPAFAAGNTHAGQTADRAVAPKPAQEAAPPPPPPVASATKNQAASRIPVAGVQYAQPKFKGGQQIKPPYPEQLKAQAIEADVVVMVTISADGKVTNVKVIRPAPEAEFNEAAKKTALQQEYEPATRDGVAIPYTLSYTYRFRLEVE
jgi:protein TonB